MSPGMRAASSGVSTGGSQTRPGAKRDLPHLSDSPRAERGMTGHETARLEGGT